MTAKQAYDADEIRGLIERPVVKGQHLFRVTALDVYANYGFAVGIGVAVFASAGDSKPIGGVSFEFRQSMDLTSRMIGVSVRQQLLGLSLRERRAEHLAAHPEEVDQ